MLLRFAATVFIILSINTSTGALIKLSSAFTIPHRVSTSASIRQRATARTSIFSRKITTIARTSAITSSRSTGSFSTLTNELSMTASSSGPGGNENEIERNNRVLELADSDDDEISEIGIPVQARDASTGTDSSSTTTANKVSAPFLSQGEISEEAMEMNWNDPKQARVMFYIILSLLPVLFLIPLMLGSRDLIPPDALPAVPIN